MLKQDIWEEIDCPRAELQSRSNVCEYLNYVVVGGGKIAIILIFNDD